MSMNNLFNQFMGTEHRHDAGKSISGISSLLEKIKDNLHEGLVGGATANSILASLLLISKAKILPTQRQAMVALRF